MYFPMFVDLKNKKCLIVGGGRVALRKAKVLLEFEAHLEVVADRTSEEMKNLLQEKRGVLIERAFKEEDLEDVFLVVAATDNEELNGRIGKLCFEKGIPVNSANNRKYSSFNFPSVVRKDQVTIGISSGGFSPVVSRRLRQDIEKAVPDFLPLVNRQLGELREKAIASIENEEKRRECFREILDLAYQKKGALSEGEIQNILEHYI